MRKLPTIKVRQQNYNIHISVKNLSETSKFIERGYRVDVAYDAESGLIFIREVDPSKIAQMAFNTPDDKPNLRQDNSLNWKRRAINMKGEVNIATSQMPEWPSHAEVELPVFAEYFDGYAYSLEAKLQGKPDPVINEPKEEDTEGEQPDSLPFANFASIEQLDDPVPTDVIKLFVQRIHDLNRILRAFPNVTASIRPDGTITGKLVIRTEKELV